MHLHDLGPLSALACKLCILQMYTWPAVPCQLQADHAASLTGPGCDVMHEQPLCRVGVGSCLHSTTINTTMHLLTAQEAEAWCHIGRCLCRCVQCSHTNQAVREQLHC